MYSDEYFKKKYFKYKMKYLGLKNTYLNIEMKGGDKPLLTNDNINLFNPTITSQEFMEPYLNPVYGSYMCESGFITNTFYLYKAFPSTELEYAKKIIKLSRSINDSIQPNLDFENVDPIDIGRYIALLYICKNNINFITINSNGRDLNVNEQFNHTDKEKKSILDSHRVTLKSYIDKIKLLKTTFPIKDSNDMTEIDFHIILYCLWWISKNDKGIINYYKGINEVITICNEILSWGKYLVKYEPIDLKYTNPNSDGFEKLVLDITKKSFHKYEMQYPQHFCSLEKKQTYPDCGEITARNLINLICFEPKTGVFNIEILQKYGAIDKLIEYYTNFNTFEKQSAEDTVKIYEQALNAKDAWSRLIIFYANNNLRFNKKCSGSHDYELLDGMASDLTTTNFFQLIKNLLPAITKWDNLNTESDRLEIVSDDTDRDGFGQIEIKTSEYSNITIFCDKGHYNMHIDKKAIDYDVSKLNASRTLKINILLNDNIVINDISNFLWINWSSDLLVRIINNSFTDIKLREKLLELSFTDKIKSDTRRQINIDVLYADFLTYFVDTFGTNDKINEYTYKSNNFEFVKRLPQLRHLNSLIYSESTCIDLTPLLNITSIGWSFLYKCVELTKIDLSPLSKVTSIGGDFLYKCIGLKNIDLTPLLHLTSIDHNFLYNCSRLENITFPYESNITSIGDFFLSNCIGLKNITFPSVSNITSIGDEFLYGIRLENIDLTFLSKVTIIGNYFLGACIELKNINLTPLSNVTSIGSNFLYDCSKLENINLTPLSNVTSIGSNFLYNCVELTKIDLSPLLNITSIGSSFLYKCVELTKIDLSPLSKVTSIGNLFLSNCIKLESIDFPSVSNITSIGNSFLSNCIGLKNIDLTFLSNVTSIGSHFLYDCSRLENINLRSRLKLKSVGTNFLSKCTSLKFINGQPIPEGALLDEYIFELVE
jgi:hypothetical protein